LAQELKRLFIIIWQGGLGEEEEEEEKRRGEAGLGEATEDERREEEEWGWCCSKAGRAGREVFSVSVFFGEEGERRTCLLEEGLEGLAFVNLSKALVACCVISEEADGPTNEEEEEEGKEVEEGEEREEEREAFPRLLISFFV
jgi:hypothetical protein